MPGNGDSGELRWDVADLGRTFPVGQTVPVEIEVELLPASNGSGQGCSGLNGDNSPSFYSPAISEVAISCSGAKCKVAYVKKLEKSLSVGLQALAAGRITIDATVANDHSGDRYRGTSHLDFVEPTELRVVHHPLISFDATRPLLVGSRFAWCAGASEAGSDIAFWAEDPAPSFTLDDGLEPVGDAAFEVVTPDTRGYLLTPRYLCQLIAVTKVGQLRVQAQLGTLSREVQLQAVDQTRVTGAHIAGPRDPAFALAQLPTWVSVADPVMQGHWQPVTRLELTSGVATSALLSSYLDLDTGESCPGGVGAMTVGPVGIATLIVNAAAKNGGGPNDAQGVAAGTESSMDPLAQSLFFIAPRSPGEASLRLQLGMFETRIPITVKPPNGVGGSGNSGGFAGAAGEPGLGGNKGESFASAGAGI